MTKRQIAETAALIGRVLHAVDFGELEANSPKARAMVRHLEGAKVALDQAQSMTFHAIADQLNRDGRPTAAGGRRWHPSTLRSLYLRGKREGAEGDLSAVSST